MISAKIWIDFVILTSLLQLFDKLQQAGKIDNLQQVCGVFGCVNLKCKLDENQAKDAADYTQFLNDSRGDFSVFYFDLEQIHVCKN